MENENLKSLTTRTKEKKWESSVRPPLWEQQLRTGLSLESAQGLISAVRDLLKSGIKCVQLSSNKVIFSSRFCAAEFWVAQTHINVNVAPWKVDIQVGKKKYWRLLSGIKEISFEVFPATIESLLFKTKRVHFCLQEDLMKTSYSRKLFCTVDGSYVMYMNLMWNYCRATELEP